MQLERQALFIDGRPAAAGSGERFTSVNPATGRPLCEVEQADAADVDRAVEAAARAFPGWSAMTGAARGRVLRRAADLLRARKEELARLEVLDTGKPIGEALAVDVDSGADCLEYFAGIAASVAGKHVDLGGQAFFYTRREPLGVCAGIGAWNYPLQIAC
jgi:betaine-aldehyde dehydrogenase